MYITLTGTYKDGEILLDEEVPAAITESKVLVTFIKDVSQIDGLKYIADASQDSSINSNTP